MFAAIRQWVIKTMMKGNTGVVQTMPKQQIIEMNVQITAERIMRNGINPEDLKSVGQVENVVKQIEQPKVNVNPGMTSVKKADVFDMEGNKIPEGSGIMGGKAVPGTSSREKVKKEAVLKAAIDQYLTETNSKRKLEILKEIFRAGLFASSHYKDIGSMYSHDFKGAKSNAQKFHSSVINLFNDFRFSDENAHKVSKLINNYI